VSCFKSRICGKFKDGSSEDMKPQGRVYITCLLQHNSTKKLFLVTVVHLKSHSKYRETREKELKEIRYFHDNFDKIYAPNFQVILGDFNDTPDAPFIEGLGTDYTNSYFQGMNGKHPEFTTMKH
jgi:endonuclease/exonuclease/phosphatase family metal-dependent hydrolase